MKIYQKSGYTKSVGLFQFATFNLAKRCKKWSYSKQIHIIEYGIADAIILSRKQANLYAACIWKKMWWLKQNSKNNNNNNTNSDDKNNGERGKHAGPKVDTYKKWKCLCRLLAFEVIP